MELIIAMSKNNIIGKNEDLPWRIPEDLKHFREITLGNIVVMGRKTFESLKGKPLDGRINIVVTSSIETSSIESNLFFCNITEIAELIKYLQEKTGKKVFIIGGSQIYKHFMDQCSVFHITLVDIIIDGDTSAPFSLGELEDNFICEKSPVKKCSKSGYEYQHLTLIRR
jgi:dihydrofolate reductase